MGPKPAAMKAMKSLPKGTPMAKAKAKAKATLTKGSKATLTKGGKGAKAKAMKVNKSTLKKSQLQKLGKMTLAQKITKAAEGAETAEEAASNLKGMLGKQEHSKVWSRHQTWLKGQSKKEKAEFEKLSKNEKGQAAAMHLIKSSAPKFMQAKESLSQATSFDKKEVWESELQMVERFGESEFWQHVESGRIKWREDPWTHNVFNYSDKGNITKNTNVQKKRQWSRGQEYQPNEEDETEWDGLWHMDSSSHMLQIENWGKGKGQSLTKGKGKKGGKGSTGALTKGKGSGSGNLLALKDKEDEDYQEEDDEEPTEEKQWKELLSKTKRARDQCSSVQADCEAAMDGAEKAKRLTKAARKETEALLSKLATKKEELKQLLAKKDKYLNLDKGKKLLVETGTLLKEVKEEAKELTQLANKAGSKASKQ